MNEPLHEFRNHLSVAIAQIEAMRDEVVDPTPARFDAILRALTEAEVLLNQIFPAAAADPEMR